MIGIVAVGTAISNDTVAMEAGRQRSTIKKLRQLLMNSFRLLIRQ